MLTVLTFAFGGFMRGIIEGKDARERLLLAGLAELEAVGVREFSLRRVAARAEVSCAAPYRYFKDKEELILAVLSYVMDGWTLLSEQIYSAFSDPADRIIRLASSGVRFWIANGSFRSVLTAGEGDFDRQRRLVLSLFDSPIKRAVFEYSDGRNADGEMLEFTVLSLIYGSVSLIEGGGDGDERIISRLEKRLGRELSL